MDSPQQQGQIPAELKAMMDEYIRQETNRILSANQPPEEKQLTPEEQARLLLVRIDALERGEKSRPSSSGATHEAQTALFAILIEAAFPQKDEEQPAPPIVVPSDTVEASAN